MSEYAVELDWYLRRQSGVISRAQARQAGLSDDAIDRRIARGRWDRLHPGVYIAADHAYTDEVRLRAAVLWAGKDAVAHGVSAAWWHDLWSRAAGHGAALAKGDRYLGRKAATIAGDASQMAIKGCGDRPRWHGVRARGGPRSPAG